MNSRERLTLCFQRLHLWSNYVGYENQLPVKGIRGWVGTPHRRDKPRTQSLPSTSQSALLPPLQSSQHGALLLPSQLQWCIVICFNYATLTSLENSGQMDKQKDI